jgi:hypothetical protein
MQELDLLNVNPSLIPLNLLAFLARAVNHFDCLIEASSVHNGFRIRLIRNTCKLKILDAEPRLWIFVLGVV